jgi:hypothetical protein
MKLQIIALTIGLVVFASPAPSQYRSYEQQQAEQRLAELKHERQRLVLELAMLKEVLALKRQYVIIFLIQGVVIGAFSAFIASQKNRRRLSWFALGFLFSIIALVALVAVPKRDEPPSRKLLWVFVTIPGLVLVVLYACWFAEWIRFPVD